MRIFRSRIWLHSLFVLATLAFLTTGCTKTVTPTAGPPTIPPLETFLIPFSTFTSGGSASAVPGESESQVQPVSYTVPDGSGSPIYETASGNQSNWDYAVFVVGAWSLVVMVGLAVPVASFVAAFYNTPVQQPDGSWIWSYSVNVFGAVYSAELHGEYIAQGVSWKMNISKEGDYQDFLWYYGESDLSATAGYWILEQNPQNPHDLLRIDWSRSIADGTYDVKYTDIVPGDAENGAYIHVQYTKETPYDYLWDIYNKGQDNHTYIDWNSTTVEGRVQDFKWFADNEWHCWDSSQANTACP